MEKRGIESVVAALQHEVVQLDQQANRLAQEIDDLMGRPEMDDLSHRLTGIYGALCLSHEKLAALANQLKRRLREEAGAQHNAAPDRAAD